MVQSQKIPTTSEWNNWMNLWLDFFKPKTPQISQVFPILIEIYEWLLSEQRPPFRTEIRENLHINHGDIFGISKQMPISTENILFKELVEMGILHIESLASWENNTKNKIKNDNNIYGKNRTYEINFSENKKKHGRTKIHELTGKGAIYFEMLLAMPWLSISICTKFLARGFLPISSLSFSILSDEKRIKLCRENIHKINSIGEKRREKILTEQREILDSFENDFWKLTNIETRLIREYFILTHLEKEYIRISKQAKSNRNIAKNELHHHNQLSKKQGTKTLQMYKRIYSETRYLKNQLELIRLFKDQIESMLKLKHLDSKELQKHKPEDDPLYHMINDELKNL